jgi:hypothetical protein
MPGTDTLEVELTNVSPHAIWLLVGDEELHLSFVDFPWFRHATIDQLADVRRPSAHHLYWPQLDVDLAVESIKDPAAFPLISRPGA